MAQWDCGLTYDQISATLLVRAMLVRLSRVVHPARTIWGMTMRSLRYLQRLLFAAVALTSAQFASAADKVRVVSAQRGNWDTTLVEWGNEKGFFQKAGLELELTYTDGGVEQVQTVIGGSADIGLAVGFLAVISAYVKGAPVDIVSAEMTGSADLYWYARADRGIKTLKEADGKTMAFSRPGSSTHLISQALVASQNPKIKLVPTGNIPATLTAVMSGQVDIGWGSIPQGFDLVDEGKIVVVASGNDAPGAATQTTRVNIANRNFLTKNPDVLKRFFQAYHQTIDWAYSADEALAKWAEVQKMDLAVARKGLQAGYPRSAVSLYPISGLDLTLTQAVEQKRLPSPMPSAKAAEMLKYVEQFARQ